MIKFRDKTGFTLIELLIVIAILALLVSILLPSLSTAKTLAKITKAHVELRNITLSMAMYKQENQQYIPPTRFSCDTQTAYDLPIELASYLPESRKDNTDIVKMPDPFTPTECYKYRAVGPAIMNESTLVKNASTLWIPHGFPYSQNQAGQYYDDPTTSPVRYAVYSMGPNPDSPKFDIPGRLPIPPKYWIESPSGTGVIVHYEDRNGMVHTSP